MSERIENLLEKAINVAERYVDIFEANCARIARTQEAKEKRDAEKEALAAQPRKPMRVVTEEKW